MGETARRERRGTRFELLVQANTEIKRGSERDVEGDFERERERDERRESYRVRKLEKREKKPTKKNGFYFYNM